VLVWSVGLIAVVCLAAVAYYVVMRRERVPFAHYSIQKVINSEHVRMTAISPDGNYLAAVVRDANGAQSLLLHHIPTNSERTILQNAAYNYRDVIFSPDGSYIYFRINALGTPQPNWEDVYRIPVLGGQATRVLQRVDASLSFIDGGKQVCFYREDPPTGTYKFLSASADGGNEQVLANGKKPFLGFAACAPRGRFAVFSRGMGEVESLDFASGSKETLSSSAALGGWLGDLLWEPNGKGVFAIRQQTARSRQVSFLSYPGGNLRQITNDLNNYFSISLTADARTIAATQYDPNGRFAELSLTEPSHIQEHQTGRLDWFTWLDNEQIVESDIGSDLRVVDLIKNEATTVSVAKGHYYSHPALCGPDALVAFGDSVAGQYGVYKMHLDGSGLTQLTKGPADYFPKCTADGKWLFYADNRDWRNPLLMRLPLQGGVAQTAIAASFWYDISSDGNLVAALNYEGAPRLHIISTDSLQEIRNFSLPTDSQDLIAFSADSKSVFYATKTGADTTIWRQPLDAVTAVKVASLPGKNVQWISSSPDGTKLGLVVLAPTSEAVLLRDLH
jgi:Tol biopolymer transport system component